MAKIPTDTQWQDLVSKVKAKQDQLTAGTGIDSTELASDTVEVDDTVVMYQTPGTTPSNVQFVNTANLYDQAVTSSKIDWATLKGSTEVPIVKASMVSTGDPAIGTWLTRIGNIVFLNSSSVLNWNVSAGEKIIGTIPVGFRPTEEVSVDGRFNISNSNPQLEYCSFYVSGNNLETLTGFWRTATAGTKRLFCTGSWVTLDPWPEA